ncbi:MAG: alkaline phosphatase [Syntrophotaleaceae bacterium]
MTRNNLVFPVLLTLSAALLLSCTPQMRQEPVAAKQPSTKNVIVMIGDGMGFNHVKAASLFLYGQADGQPYHAFPVRVAMSTYAAGGQYDPQGFWTDYLSAGTGATDSGAAATAMATGHKTYRYAIGVDMQRQPLRNVVEVAEETGRSTGVITTVPVSHATPAGFVAHNPTRKNMEEIARYMINESGLEVLMGCGHPWFDRNGEKRAEPGSFRSVGGESTWSALEQGTAGGDMDGDGKEDPWTLIEDRQAFRELAEGATPGRVIGIARIAPTLQQKRGDSSEDGTYASDPPFAVPLVETVPTLAEMAAAALNVLDEDEDGFFLMIEGGAIDWASHANQAGRMIEEQIAFDHAVARVIAWVETRSSWEETLLIVTADHETGFLNGPGSSDRPNPLVGNGLLRVPNLQWQSAEHTNSLVPFFARGAGADSFLQHLLPSPDPVRGLYLDNTAIAKGVMALLEGSASKN